MVETPSMHLQRPERTNHNSQNEITDPITPITCVICEASYAPSPLSQRFLQVSPIVLESAYMSMCHYCFRCRRPACPECWDTVHGICGACVQEANLPFRIQVKPLDGVLFLPASQASLTSQTQTTQENTASSLFVCVKHGKFHTSASLSNDISNILPAETTTKASTSNPPEPPPQIDGQNYTMVEPTAELAVGAVSLGDSLPLAGILLPSRPGPINRPPTSSDAQADPHIVGAGLAPALETSPTWETSPTKRGGSIVKKVERAFTIIVLLVLLAVIVMIALAEYFPTVNTFIAHLLHIDIRAEIAYLLHLVQQLL